MSRMRDDADFRDAVLDQLVDDQRQLGEMVATLMVNFGKPYEGFGGGKIAHVVEKEDRPLRMMIYVLEWLMTDYVEPAATSTSSTSD